MKKLKVYYMGERLRDVYPHATKWQVLKWRVREFVKKVIRLATMGGVGAIVVTTIFMAGQWSSPVHITAQTVIDEKDSPVLDRIAGCESEGNRNSKGSHYGKDGQVRTNANTNKSVDIGKFQINQSAWGKKATELGLNLWVEKDNKTMAEWIYANRGTEDWYSSKSCWK
jgi:hypothetical protein